MGLLKNIDKLVEEKNELKERIRRKSREDVEALKKIGAKIRKKAKEIIE